VLILGGIIAAALLLGRLGMPARVGISYRLPPSVQTLAIEYEQDGEIVRRATFGWGDEDSPRVVRHEPELVPGTARVMATLRDHAGEERTVERNVRVDPDHVARVDLR
jgi:predicted anti-sigma-YlaC factor YlaD